MMFPSIDLNWKSYNEMKLISNEITQTLANFSLKIMKNRENYHLRISRFPQIVKREIIFMLDSCQCWSRSFTSHNYVLMMDHENFILFLKNI